MSRNRQFDEWLELLENDRTKGTAGCYKSWARRFEDWIEYAEWSVTSDILLLFEQFLRDPEKLNAFKETITEHSVWNHAQIPKDGYSYRTRVQAISAVKSYVDTVYGVEFEDREMHKVNHIVRGEEPDFDPVIATPDQVKEIFEETRNCVSDSCHMMTRLGYDCIMRGIELSRVQWDGVDMDRGTIYVRSAKGSPKRHIALSDGTLRELAEYREFVKTEFKDPQYLFYRFYNFGNNRPWTPGKWGGHFTRHWEGGWHSFGRHSAITNRLNAGQSISDVSRRARHARLSNTQKYIHFVSNGESTPPELQ